MNVQNLNSFGTSTNYLSSPTCSLTPASLLDPFADEGDPLGGNQDVGSTQNYLHIRIQQRNGRKTLTTLQGLPKGELAVGFVVMQFLSLVTEYDPKKLLKAFKKVF